MSRGGDLDEAAEKTGTRKQEEQMNWPRGSRTRVRPRLPRSASDVKGDQTITNRTYLDDFRKTVGKLSLWKSAQESSIDKDVRGLPERPDEVLAEGRVDSSLAADRGVDHGEQGCGDLHHTHPAHAVCV